MMKNQIATVAVLLFLLYASTAIAYDGEMLATAISDFSQRFDTKIREKGQSVVYSPYSIHSALSMTSTGAKGETLTEMRRVLSLTDLGDATNLAYHGLINELNSASSVELKTGNALFYAPGLETKKRFRDEVKSHYLGDVSELDFNAEGGPEQAVNDYVAEKTSNMIKHMFEEGSIGGNTLLVLINTIFFNGTWDHQFNAGSTQEQDFHVDGKTQKVDMMKTASAFGWKYDEDISSEVLKMDFLGRRFAFYVVLPRKNEKTIDEVEKDLDGFGIQFIFQGLENTLLSVKIPKFKITTKLELVSPLKDMGMQRAFSPSADFTGISDEAHLSIDQAIHQAVIEVKETGTVAAAATAIIMGRSGTFEPKQKFTADRPFLFFLRDSKTNQVLFRGKFTG